MSASEGTTEAEGKKKRSWKRWAAYALIVLAVLGVAVVALLQYAQESALRGFHNGKLEAADYWSEKPAILSGGLGFDNIIGVPEVTRETVRAAGGSWYEGLTCSNGDEPETSVLTSVASKDTIERGYRG